VSSPHAVLRTIGERHAAGSRPGERDDGAYVALAIEGGGMRGAVSAGMAIALHDLGLLDAFDSVYGASAGALNGVWLLSGNPDEGLRPYGDPALMRQYIRRSNLLRRRPVVDTGHLVEHLYENELPLRFDRVLEHRVRLHPLATDVETGRAVDLEPTIRDKPSLKLALRASTALPLLAGPPVEIDGRRYVDAGLAESIPFHAAVAAGATHVLVLRSRRPQDDERPSGLSRAVTSALLGRLGEPVRRGYLDRARRLAEDDALLDRHAADATLEPAMFAIRPSSDSPRVSRLESDAGVVNAGLEAGRAAALSVLRPIAGGG
jgi:predicted patatin/cPLA2 family phospholipase